jgi:hypothetical protein
MTEQQKFLDNVLTWLRKGYPEGVPPKDYFPLLALLKRTLTEDEVVHAAFAVLKTDHNADAVTPEQIAEAIKEVTTKEPNPAEVHQVAARLASVGWPLTGTRA